MQAIIVIPVYKKELSDTEVKSLNQCFKVLSEFPICFVCGNSFAIENYADLLLNKAYIVKRFDDKYFISLDSYSLLLLSIEFYKAFKSYEYMLLYQLDAWVFKNELMYWIEKDFSYIGAPWLDGFSKATKQSSFIGVGNGGFSLRHIRSHIHVLKIFNKRVLPLYYLKEFGKNPSITGFKLLIKNISFRCNAFYKYRSYPYKDYPIYEDVFWGRIAAKIFSFFTVPDPKTAIRFSVETVPSAFVNEQNIPFGCHAWNYYEPDFWKSFLNRDNFANKFFKAGANYKD